MDTIGRFDDEYVPCPLATLLATLGGKWKCIILWWLMNGPRRFSELRCRIPGITQKMLTQQLRELEKDRFVTRRVFAEVPPRVEYTATPLAVRMKSLLLEMNDWAMVNLLHSPPKRTRRPGK